jgi:3-oxoacyl-(acyl-carrier-protein) synthase
MYRCTPIIQTKFTLEKMANVLDINNRLEQRVLVHPMELDFALETRARMHHTGAPYSPVYPATTDTLHPGTYYLNNIDAQWRRTYSRVPFPSLDDKAPPSSKPDPAIPFPLAPTSVLQWAQNNAVIPQSEVGTIPASVTRDTDPVSKRTISCVITGTAAGLPGRPLAFNKDNMERLINGEQCIGPISPTGIQSLLEKNVVQTKKLSDGSTQRVHVDNESETIKLAAQLGCCDLTKSYGVSEGLAQTMDIAAQVAVAAGLEALKDAGLVSGRSNDPNEWMLPEQYRDSTGVVYASSFPAMDAAVGEVMRFLQSKTVTATDSEHLIETLRDRLLRGSVNNQLTDEDEAALQRLMTSAKLCNGGHHRSDAPYEFDRKFLFRVLVLGNAQLAQLAGCRGPNTQTNAACAGTTQAIAMAQDMLISGRAQRVVVVAGDNASGTTLLPWLGSGFRALGAACTKGSVEDAAMPFDKRRSGMLIGAGGIGMVLETEKSQIERHNAALYPFDVKARLLATQYSNSAFHGAALDRNHIGSELKRFLTDIEALYGISMNDIASHGVYFSHETSTHASDASSCSGNEVAALRSTFGDELLSKLLIVNTKGFTGHVRSTFFSLSLNQLICMSDIFYLRPITNAVKPLWWLADGGVL